ncbi:MAG: phosphotransferase enzyme family protein [Pirellulales bacterium]
MDDRELLETVLSEYSEDPKPGKIEPLGAAGGFSGACFWRIAARHGAFCLRQWPPEHPSAERLGYIHRLLRHVHDRGFHIVPLPIPTRTAATFVAHGGRLWQLEPWLAGVADYHDRPTPAKLRAALETLGRFHQVARDFSKPVLAPSPGIVDRRRQFDDLLQGQLEVVAAAIEAGGWPTRQRQGRLLLRRFSALCPDVVRQLDWAMRYDVMLQPCIRDVRSEHVLFSGARVSGLVDFGAVRQENVAFDVSRLLGSLAGCDTKAWRAGVAAYESIRPLSTVERQLLGPLDRSGLLLGGMNWMEWIYVEGRAFEDRLAVERRIDAILDRLDRPAVELGE